MSASEIPEITVQELKKRLAQVEEQVSEGGKNRLLLLDVREPDEWQICRLPDAVLVPLSGLAQRGRAALPAQLTPEKPVVVYCHHGVRSAQVTAWLDGLGFHGVVNLAGGIDAWSVQIDPSVPRYF